MWGKQWEFCLRKKFQVLKLVKKIHYQKILKNHQIFVSRKITVGNYSFILFAHKLFFLKLLLWLVFFWNYVELMFSNYLSLIGAKKEYSSLTYFLFFCLTFILKVVGFFSPIFGWLFSVFGSFLLGLLSISMMNDDRRRQCNLKDFVGVNMFLRKFIFQRTPLCLDFGIFSKSSDFLRKMVFFVDLFSY